jgi:predicted  nucleic acid-binding Zn-ribbon protein
LADASKSQDSELAELDQQIADLTTKTDAAAADKDYEQAVTLVNELSAKVEEKFQAIEQKKQEYETARKTLDGRMATVSACK